jgi:hypothetical protein
LLVHDLFEMDWSFVVVVVSVSALMLLLGIRSRILKRQRKIEEKRLASRLYTEWLNSSQMSDLETTHSPNEPR